MSRKIALIAFTALTVAAGSLGAAGPAFAGAIIHQNSDSLSLNFTRDPNTGALIDPNFAIGPEYRTTKCLIGLVNGKCPDPNLGGVIIPEYKVGH